MSKEINKTGYKKALELMEVCNSEDGFLATTINKDNYRRIWARDGCVLGLAALMTGDESLIEGCRKTLQTLAEHQGPHGEIPSNVDTKTRRISYGGTAGRVDADLWFLVTCGQYWKVTGDEDFIESILDHIEKVRFLLGVWEFNNRGLIYVPITGDWADEYLHTGYVLYDQLLYLQAQREVCAIHKLIHGSEDHSLKEKITRLKALIHDNYWLTGKEELPDMVYHEVPFKKGLKAMNRCANKYWAPFFSPAGYGYRFDTLANVLASLLTVSNDHRVDAVDEYIENKLTRSDNKLPLPAFHPVIKPTDDDWEDLQLTFSYKFKNEPYEYHNGGLWPFVTGFYVADLVERGKQKKAERYLEAINLANQKERAGQEWSFSEYLHGKSYEPGGTRQMGWSAAASVIGYQALNGKKLFSSD